MFTKNYDVVVCGAGVAGVAAALASARLGKKTAIIEKTVYTGGLATSGLIYIYLPLCDGNGTQVSFGITEELLKASILYGPGEIPANWKNQKNAEEQKRYRTIFAPASFTLAIDELLLEAKVDIWYDTLVCATQVDKDKRLTGVEVENKSGRGLITAKSFVDATGDSDLAHMAELPCHTNDNALANWVLEYNDRTNWPMSARTHGVCIHMGGTNVDSKAGYRGINGASVSRFLLQGRERYLKDLKAAYASGKHERDTRFPLQLPAMAQFRMTRCIPAHYMLKDNQDWTPFEDSIGLAADWRKSGYVWEIPFSSMTPVGLKNMVAAGRCTCSEPDAWEVTRVIPVAGLTGEAAGTAAALAADKSISPDELKITELQDTLRKNGNKIHFDEVGLDPAKFKKK